MTKTLPVATEAVEVETPDFLMAFASAITKHLGLTPEIPTIYAVALALNREGFVIIPSSHVKTFDDLVKALEPFAAYAEAIDGSPASSPLGDICPLIVDPSLWDDTTKRPTLGDARRAREVIAALARSKAKGGE